MICRLYHAVECTSFIYGFRLLLAEPQPEELGRCVLPWSGICACWFMAGDDLGLYVGPEAASARDYFQYTSIRCR